MRQRLGRTLILLASMLLGAGCNVVSTRLQPTLEPAANIGTSVTCQDGCKAEWERAQLWIANHSKWKMQISTDVLIQTYNPVNHDVSYGFAVTKEPIGNGRYLIRLALACGNLYGCDPKPIDVSKAFYYYVKNGRDLLQGQGYMGAIR